MEISKNKVVTIHYKLNENDVNGELIEDSHEGEPLSFIFGIGMMIPSFEDNLDGKSTGEKFSFTLQPEEAYGPYEKDSIVEFPIDNFADDEGNIDHDSLVQGVMINMHDQDGRTYTGTIALVLEDTVTIDFNHPMAGMSLHFEGEVLEVRDATETELSHGHVHGEGHDHEHDHHH